MKNRVSTGVPFYRLALWFSLWTVLSMVAVIHRPRLENADLRGVNLQGVQWKDIKSIEKANIHAVRNAPDGFVAWAIQHKAVSVAGEE